MRLIAEIRIRARHIIGPVLGICAVGYFSYHLVHGDRGLFAWWNLTQRIADASEVLSDLNAERRKLDHRVKMLHPQSIDPDMLDERARVMLNYGLPNEVVVITGKPRT